MILVVCAYSAIIVYLTWPISEISVNKSGVFGDSFGLLTSLFSGLAFSGLIITILLQREDILLQRQELTETRNEIKFQNFESTFFQMLRLHNNIVDSIDIRKLGKDKSIVATGRDCFVIFFRDLKKSYDDEVARFLEVTELEMVVVSYDMFWDSKKQDLGHYFRYLYRLFKYVDESFVKKDQKALYASIVRAQLSDYETALLFYNCLSSHGSEKFKPLVEKYWLLDNLPLELLFNMDHASFYNESAFGDSG